MIGLMSYVFNFEIKDEMPFQIKFKTYVHTQGTDFVNPMVSPSYILLLQNIPIAG